MKPQITQVTTVQEAVTLDFSNEKSASADPMQALKMVALRIKDGWKPLRATVVFEKSIVTGMTGPRGRRVRRSG